MSLCFIDFRRKIIYFSGYTPIKMGVFFGKTCFFSKIPPLWHHVATGGKKSLFVLSIFPVGGSVFAAYGCYVTYIL